MNVMVWNYFIIADGNEYFEMFDFELFDPFWNSYLNRFKSLNLTKGGRYY